MSILECPKQWNGSLEDFLNEFVIKNLPGKEKMLDFHRGIKSLHMGEINFFVRSLGSGTSARGVPTGILQNRLYNCDNAPAIWIYNQLKSNFKSSLELEKLLFKKDIPLRDIGAREGESLYCWSKKNADPGNFRSSDGGRWKLCHIYSVKKGIPENEEWYSKRFIRLIHPFNLFLFPRPIRKGKGYYSIGNDLGESDIVCSEVARKIQVIVGNEAWSEFLNLIGANEISKVGSIKIPIETIDLKWEENTRSTQIKTLDLDKQHDEAAMDDKLMAEANKSDTLTWNEFLKRCEDIASSNASDEDVIAPGGFGQRPYIHVTLPDGSVGALNADAKVKGIRQFLKYFKEKIELEIVENKNGVINKIQVKGKGKIQRFPFYKI